MTDDTQTRRDDKSFGRREIDKARAAEWYQAQAKLAMFDAMLEALRRATIGLVWHENQSGMTDASGTVDNCRALLARVEGLK